MFLSNRTRSRQCYRGRTVGAVAAAIAAIGTTLVIPGLSIVIAGPIAAAYEEEIKHGGILIGVKTSDEKFTEIKNELNRLNSSI